MWCARPVPGQVASRKVVAPCCQPLLLPLLCPRGPAQIVPLMSMASRHPFEGARALLPRKQHVVARAMLPSDVVATSAAAQWWKKDADLWIQVHDAEGFKTEVLQSNLPVIVDWFASWCTGCQRSYPEVCKIIRNSPELRSGFKFVKICVDDVKALSREQGVSALPRMTLYRPGQGRVLTWDIPMSRVKHLKQNLKTVLDNPTSVLAMDPNAFIIATGQPFNADEVKKAAAAKAEAIAALDRGKDSLFDRLRAVATNATARPGPNGAAAAAAPAAATSTSQAATNGNGNGNGSVQPAAPAPALSPLGAPVPLTEEQYLASFEAQFGQSYLLDRQMFLNRANGEYGYGARIDELYPREVGVRMAPIGPTHKQQHYLDYTGSGVYCSSQLEAAFKELSTTMFGNPHAQNPSSQLSAERVDEVRSQILQFFNADPAEWQVVFTRSATGALKLVGETFPWSAGSLFRYLRENHNSVLGIREYALTNGGAFQAVDEMLVTEWLRAAPPPAEDEGEDPPSQHDHTPDSCTGHNAQGACEVEWGDESDDATPIANAGQEEITYSLFAFPAEDNFAGVKYPLSWAADIKRRSTNNHKWMVLIDAAAYVPTQPLDLSQVAADYVDVAFYKMFGYPTGLGALLVRTEAVPLMKKVFWGGGSVALATSNDNFHVLKCRPNEMLEDGTVSFLDIISLKHGFNVLTQLGGITSVQSHVASLTEWLYEALSKLRHSNGKPMTRIFGKHAKFDHRKVQGGIVNFELRSPQGLPLSYKGFEREAALAGIHVRTGAECNPGACYAYLGIADEEVEQLAGVKEGCEDEVEFVSVQRPASKQVHSSNTLRTLSTAQRVELGLPQADPDSTWVQAPLGSVRVSLGWMSTFEDVYALANLVANYKDCEAIEATTV